MVTGKGNTPLRFAALVRVSTERQEQQGESLRVQKAEIEQAVQTLGGKIAGWYGGQEHATEGHERLELDRLLADAQKARFDAFICAHPDRWSRDNLKSHQGLEVFRDHGIRFFAPTEYNLNDPTAVMYLEISASVGKFQARNQRNKSMASRISRAKRGIPSGGKLPYGRRFDSEGEQWRIDEDKQKVIAEIAERYLAGEKLAALAAEFQMDLSTLHGTLTERCGDTWEQTFYPERIKNDPGPALVIPTKIPRLLPEETIKAIHARMEANKTYTHGQMKNTYLLSRMVFCATCGTAMYGQTSRRTNRYYRHLDRTRMKKNTRQCNHCDGWVRADELEELVTLALFQTFGNPVAVQQAIERASGDMEQVSEYQARMERVDADLKKIETGRQRILDLIVKGTITTAQTEAKLSDLKDREAKLREEQGRLADYLGNRPSPEQIKAVSKKVAAEMTRLQCRTTTARRVASRKPFSKMTEAEKTALLQMVFSGKTPDGKRMGIHIEFDDMGNWTFSIRGHLLEQEGLIRLPEKIKAEMHEYFEGGSPNIIDGQNLLSKYRLYSRFRAWTGAYRGRPAGPRPESALGPGAGAPWPRAGRPPWSPFLRSLSSFAGSPPGSHSTHRSSDD